MPAIAGFEMRRLDDARHFLVRPARPALGFLAAAVLLGGLFGLAALSVLLNPARHDPVSLGAAMVALGVTALAGLALRHAWHGRRPALIATDAEGLRGAGWRLPWADLAGLRVERPADATHPAAGGIHALAARVAAQQRAAEARLVAQRATPSRPLLLAGGLDVETAEALRLALLAERPGAVSAPA